MTFSDDRSRPSAGLADGLDFNVTRRTSQVAVEPVRRPGFDVESILATRDLGLLIQEVCGCGSGHFSADIVRPRAHPRVRRALDAQSGEPGMFSTTCLSGEVVLDRVRGVIALPGSTTFLVSSYGNERRWYCSSRFVRSFGCHPSEFPPEMSQTCVTVRGPSKDRGAAFPSRSLLPVLAESFTESAGR